MEIFCNAEPVEAQNIAMKRRAVWAESYCRCFSSLRLRYRCEIGTLQEG